MRKVVKIGEKTFLVDDEGKTEEIEKDEEETVDEADEEDAGDEADKEDEDEKEEASSENEDEDDESIDKAVEQMIDKMGISDIKKSIAELKDLNKKPELEKKFADLEPLEKLMKKKVSDMTANEKIVGFFQGLLRNNVAVVKALSEGTDADGGFLFPDEFRAEILRDIADTPRMRNEVRVVTMRRDVMNTPSLADRPRVTWTAENAAKSTTTAHFGQKVLTVRKMAAILYASDELIDDSDSFDVVQLIISLFSEAIGEEEDRVITAGNGTTEPVGYSIGVGTTEITERTNAGNLDFDNIIRLVHDLDRKYYPNAKFYVHKNNIQELRLLKDTTNRYLWQDPVSADQPTTIYGFPVVWDNNLPESKIFFGDLRRAYWLGDRQRMTVKVSQDTETAFTKDQTAIRVVSRIAGQVVVPFAVKALVSIP